MSKHVYDGREIFDQPATSASLVSLYGSYVATKAWFTPEESFVALDPGTIPDPAYYSVADLILTYQDKYAKFQISDLTITTPASKQAVILHTATSGPQNTIIDELVNNDIAAIFITNIADNSSTGFDPYSGFLADWAVDAVTEAQ